MGNVYEMTCGCCNNRMCNFCRYNKSKNNYELYHGKVESDGSKEYMEQDIDILFES